jgi:hypothetical protein
MKPHLYQRCRESSRKERISTSGNGVDARVKTELLEDTFKQQFEIERFLPLEM